MYVFKPENPFLLVFRPWLWVATYERVVQLHAEFLLFATKKWNHCLTEYKANVFKTSDTYFGNKTFFQRGLIRTPEDVFTINPLPDRLGLGKNKTRAHVIHRRSTTPLESAGKALRVEKRSANWCGVEGW